MQPRRREDEIATDGQLFDEDMREKDETATLDEASPQPRTSPAREVNSDAPSNTGAAPRMARFGEGDEGTSARRERGTTGARAGFFERLGQFFRDVSGELKRVSWPSTTQVRNMTVITIITVIFFALYLLVVDTIWTFLVTQLGMFVEWLLTRV